MNTSSTIGRATITGFLETGVMVLKSSKAGHLAINLQRRATNEHQPRSIQPW